VSFSLAERVALLPVDEREEWIRSLPPVMIRDILNEEWWWTARPEQVPPPGDWLICLALAGRGFGKSRAGSEWIVERVLKHPFDRQGVATEWLVVADTLADARTINAEGPSGILNVLKRRGVQHRYKQNPRPMILFPAGAKIYLEGADTPDTGRGYNAAGILCDELAKWLKPFETWYHGLLPSLRADLVDDHPRAFVTTTPKPIALLEDWVARADGTVHLITGSTFDNSSNLSHHALAEMKRQYDGTAIGEQELYGKLLELTGGGLFHRKNLTRDRVVDPPDDITSVVVGCDPNLTGEDAAFGIVVVARTKDKHLYVLADRSTPNSGRAAVLEAWRAVADYAADVLVYEENLGKRYLEEVLRDAYRELIDQDVFPRHTSPPMQAVHAKHGKKTRAEPVAMRSEQGRLHLVGDWPELEKEMVMFDPESTRESPDRMDAMVHACIKLMAGERREMRVANPNEYQFQMDQSFYDLSKLY
jgi:phage terminase large subunit-like protein